ncbi:MAG: hypothetical protein QM673_11620 [Gordonia sp. (in: high G+C Gram-positive bacteria)]
MTTPATRESSVFYPSGVTSAMYNVRSSCTGIAVSSFALVVILVALLLG